MTRRGAITRIVGCAAVALGPAAIARASETPERRALFRILRRAEMWGGHALGTDGPAIPPRGSVYREFWDLAQEGLSTEGR